MKFKFMSKFTTWVYSWPNSRPNSRPEFIHDQIHVQSNDQSHVLSLFDAWWIRDIRTLVEAFKIKNISKDIGWTSHTPRPQGSVTSIFYTKKSSVRPPPSGASLSEAKCLTFHKFKIKSKFRYARLPSSLQSMSEVFEIVFVWEHPESATDLFNVEGIYIWQPEWKDAAKVRSCVTSWRMRRTSPASSISQIDSTTWTSDMANQKLDGGNIKRLWAACWIDFNKK